MTLQGEHLKKKKISYSSRFGIHCIIVHMLLNLLLGTFDIYIDVLYGNRSWVNFLQNLAILTLMI